MALEYPYGIEDDLECLQVRPRRDSWFDHTYKTLKVNDWLPIAGWAGETAQHLLVLTILGWFSSNETTDHYWLFVNLIYL